MFHKRSHGVLLFLFYLLSCFFVSGLVEFREKLQGGHIPSTFCIDTPGISHLGFLSSGFRDLGVSP